MLSPKPFRLLALLLGGTLVLAACGGQPSAPAPTARAYRCASATSAPTAQPAAAPAPTADSSPPAPTAAPQPSATSAPSATPSPSAYRPARQGLRAARSRSGRSS